MELNEKDKYLIQGMLVAGKSVDEIMDILPKNRERVEVDSFVNSLNTTKQPTEETDEIAAQVLYQLDALGLNGADLVDLVNELKNSKEQEPAEIKQEVINRASGMRLLKNKTEGGNSGVVAMTQPASERADELRKRIKPKQPDYLFNPRKK